MSKKGKGINGNYILFEVTIVTHLFLEKPIPKNYR